MINIAPFVNKAEFDDEARSVTAREWDRAMKEVGFAFIDGHGVETDVISSMRRGAKAFFESDTTQKLAHVYGDAYGSSSGGYTGMGKEAVTRTRDDHGLDGGCAASDDSKATALPDLVESYVFTGKPHQWGVELPAHPEEMALAARQYHVDLERVLSVCCCVLPSQLCCFTCTTFHGICSDT